MAILSEILRQSRCKVVIPRDYLFQFERLGVKLGLDNIRHLLHAANSPQTEYPSVHVAGTNGKGSVAAMLAVMVRASGYRVGRFTSPHLIDIAERFVVNGGHNPTGPH